MFVSKIAAFFVVVVVFIVNSRSLTHIKHSRFVSCELCVLAPAACDGFEEGKMAEISINVCHKTQAYLLSTTHSKYLFSQSLCRFATLLFFVRFVHHSTMPKHSENSFHWQSIGILFSLCHFFYRTFTFLVVYTRSSSCFLLLLLLLLLLVWFIQPCWPLDKANA